MDLVRISARWLRIQNHAKEYNTTGISCCLGLSSDYYLCDDNANYSYSTWLEKDGTAQGILHLEFLTWNFRTSGCIIVPLWFNFQYNQAITLSVKRVLITKKEQMQQKRKSETVLKPEGQAGTEKKSFMWCFSTLFSLSCLMLVDLRDSSYIIKKAREQSWREQ